MAQEAILGTELSPEAEKAVALAEKLLRTAGRNPEEAAGYVAKAMEILAAHNLDMAAVEEFGEGGQGKRAEQKLKGGYFQFQRDLWSAVARLNFCLYWNQVYIERTKRWVNEGGQFVRRYKDKRAYQHRVVGRQVNVRLTISMSEYLESAIERILRERLDENNEQFRGKWATSFREGAADCITDKIFARRRQLIKEQERAARDAQKAAHAAGMANASTATGLTLSTLVDQERNANLDFLYGEGWSAEQSRANAEHQARQAAAKKAAEEVYTAWALANPEQAAQDAKEERDRERKNAAARERYYQQHGHRERTTVYKGDYGAFRAGREAAEKIGIDPQARGSRAAGAIG